MVWLQREEEKSKYFSFFVIFPVDNFAEEVTLLAWGKMVDCP
jgi:hypothetical protein